MFDDMGLDIIVELALANMDLNEQVLELVPFDNGDLLKGSSSTPTKTNIRVGIEEENGGGSSGSDVEFDDHDMKDY